MKSVQLTTWEDYGINKLRYRELRILCQSGDYNDLVRSAAYEANAVIADYIILSVKENKSYEGIEFIKGLGRIPCGRTDFYGYRRRFYHIFDKKIKTLRCTGHVTMAK